MRKKKWTDFTAKTRYKELGDINPRCDPNANNVKHTQMDYHTYADDTSIKCRNDNEIAPKLKCYADAARDFFLEVQWKKHILYTKGVPRN